MKRNVPYVDLAAQYDEEKEAIHACVERVFRSGQFIGGEVVEQFEARVCGFLGAEHAVALNSGTDALVLAMTVHGIGPGDEVITPPNSFIASTSSVFRVQARPVFADVRPDQNLDPDAVAAAITPRTKAIMAVHLTGRIAPMDELRALAKRHGLLLIEDAAQAFGSKHAGRHAGTIGDIGCFSMHPLKNLNAAGDGGIVVTRDAALAERLRLLRNHGLISRDTAVEVGMVSRLDALQAAFLTMRLDRLGSVIERRRRNAARYREMLNADVVFSPPCRDIEFNTFHTFVVQVPERDRLKQHLAEAGIGTGIHYPVPIHLQPVAASLGGQPGHFPATERQASRILSLPIHQFLTESDIQYVAESINRFYVAPSGKAASASAAVRNGGRT